MWLYFTWPILPWQINQNPQAISLNQIAILVQMAKGRIDRKFSIGHFGVVIGSVPESSRHGYGCGFFGFLGLAAWGARVGSGCWILVGREIAANKNLIANSFSPITGFAWLAVRAEAVWKLQDAYLEIVPIKS